MRGKLNRHGLAVLIIVALITSLLVPTTGFVLADEGTPAPETTSAPTEVAPTDVAPTDATPTDAAPTDAASTVVAPAEATATDAAPTDATPTDAAPTDTPVVDATATEQALEAAQDAGVTVVPVDETGAAVSLASAEAAQILSAPDPYFTIGVTTYNFSAADCDPDTPGDQACSNPIQAAIDYLAVNDMTPDDGIVYVEAGTYSEDVTIQGLNWTSTPAALALFGVSGSGSTTINGFVNIFNLINVALDGFAINGQVFADSNTGNLFLNDLVITNPAGDGLVVTNHSGDISVSNVDSSGNGGSGAYLDNTAGTGNVVVDPSTFNNNSGDGLSVNSNGDITLTDVTANGNGGSGAYLDNCAISGAACTNSGDVTVSNSAFNNNDYNGLDVATDGAIQITDLAANGNGQASGGWGSGFSNCTWNGSDCNSTADSITINAASLSNNNYNGADLRTGGAVTLNDITADGNGLSGDYGTGLDACNWNGTDCAGVGSFSLGGTNSFSNNLDNGLNVYSTGVITLSNVTASGNDGNGASLDNCLWGDSACTGTGDIFVDPSTFNGNWNGLMAFSTGDVTLTDVIASGNDRHGALLSTSSGDVLVDPSTFNDNGYVGLEVFADTGSVTFTDVTANNNGFSATWDPDYPFHGNGASIWAGSGNILVDPSTFNNNAFFGLYAEIDGGTITLDRVTANGNGLGTDATDSYSGVRLDTTLGNGNITVTCSTFTGNGYNGIFADAGTGTMTLNSVTAAGNGVTIPGAPDVFLGSGTLVTNTVECVPPTPIIEETGPGVVLSPVIQVTGGEQVTLSTLTSTTLQLVGGNQVSIDPGVGTTASVTPNTEASLPGALPAGTTFASGMTVSVMNGGTAVSTLPAGKVMVASFVVPPSLAGHTFSILYWNPALNGGLGGWAEVPATVTPDGRVVASVNFTGTFVLVAN